MPTKIKPVPGYILVEPIDDKEEFSGGLVMPESAQDKPAKGLVLAIGGDLEERDRTVSCPAKVGDTVIYKRYGGQEIRENGKVVKLVRFDELMGVYGNF